MNNKRLAIMVSDVLGHVEYRLERIEQQIQETTSSSAAIVYFTQLVGIRKELEDIWGYFSDDQDNLAFDLDEKKS